MEGNLEESYLSEIMTLEKTIESEGYTYPVLVKTCGNEYLRQTPAIQDDILPADSLLMLEKVAVMNYGHLRVMPLENDNNATRDKGAEFTKKYTGFVGEDILIPLDYSSPIKIIHPPGKSTQYVDVSQVLDDLPRYIKVNVDTKTKPPFGYICSPLARIGTTLEVKQVVLQDTRRYLKCTSKHKETFFFSEDTIVNFSAVQDTKLYTLLDLLRSDVLLPKFVKFQTEPPIDDIISSSNTWINNTSVMTYGPMQLVKEKQREVIVAWSSNGPRQIFREGTGPHYHVILIPKSRWSIENVKVCRFKTEQNKKDFLERKFPLDFSSDFTANKLYLMRKDKTAVTYIDSNIRVPDEINEDSSERWEEWYSIPGPAVQARTPICSDNKSPLQGKTNKAKLRPDIVDMLKMKARLGFGNLHKELVDVCSKTKNKVVKKTEYFLSKKSPGVKKNTSRSNSVTDSICDDDMEGRQHPEIFKSPSTTEDIRPSSNVYDYVFESFGTQTKDSKTISTPNFSKGMIPSYTTSCDSEYEQLIVDETGSLLGNQTTETFSEYSVEQVAKCFELCALEDFAERCKEQKVDGALLTSLDLNCLKEKPFNLTEFNIRKVKMIIKGWRPLYETLKG